MAITIRDVEQHDKMLSDLKGLTGESTASKSLVKGGYLALDYHDKFRKQSQRVSELENELRLLRRDVSDFFRSFDRLKDLK